MSFINVFLVIDNVTVGMQIDRADFMNKSIKDILKGKKDDWTDSAQRRARLRQRPLNLVGKKTPDDVLRNVDDYEIEMVYDIKTGSGLMDYERKSIMIDDITKIIQNLLGSDRLNLHVFFRSGPTINIVIKQKSPPISEPEPEESTDDVMGSQSATDQTDQDLGGGGKISKRRKSKRKKSKRKSRRRKFKRRMSKTRRRSR